MAHERALYGADDRDQQQIDHEVEHAGNGEDLENREGLAHQPLGEVKPSRTGAASLLKPASARPKSTAWRRRSNTTTCPRRLRRSVDVIPETQALLGLTA